jgi:transposase/regulator of replication initiation timing
MEEQVNDMSQTLQAIVEELQQLRESNDAQYNLICQLNRNSGAQLREIRSLRKENSILRERLSKYEQPPKDSNNSSTPPCKENMESEMKRRTKSLRKRSGKPIGGQKGHEGSTREKSGNVDEIVDHASTYCSCCGDDISAIEPTLEYTSQEIDIPIVQPVIREHRYFSKVCRCGHRNRSYTPRQKGGNVVTFGENIQALVVYYNVVQCIPYQRLQLMLKAIFGIEMSQGTISNIIRQTKKKAEPAIALIKEYISGSPVVGFDESGCYCNKRLDWSWIAQTVYYTLVFRATGRSCKVLEDMFGNALKNMTAVTDRHSAYFALNFVSHQICLAHILREVQYLNELDDKQQWSVDLQTLLREAIHHRKQNPDKVIDSSAWLLRLDNILKQNIEHLKDEFRRLKNGLIKCRDYIFKFLENPAIPPDNNASERGIRKLKIKQKISGTFRSDQGADAFMAIHSIADTAWKNKQSPFQAILTVIQAAETTCAIG